MAEVSFHEVAKIFPGGTTAVEDVTLDVADGEFMVLVGPSGCGKTTVLRMVAGLEEPTHGAVVIDGTVVNGIAPKDRDIAMVFQSYALYPQKTVKQNLAFGLNQHKVPKQDVEQRVQEVSSLLALDELLDRKPAQLSGGQRQRVAMGRALARKPKVFLLDEPLSNLDAQLRTQLRADLKQLHARFPTTSIYVTHDQTEAMTLGDRVAVMNKGHLLQLGTPQEIYERPVNLFVASFIGSPPMNLVKGEVVDTTLNCGDLRLHADGVRPGPVIVGIRPEALEPAEASGDGRSIELRVHVVESLGHECILYGTVRGEAATISDIAALSGSEGGVPVVARVGVKSRPSSGTTVSLGVTPDDVHMFDPDSGERIDQNVRQMADERPTPAGKKT